MNRIVFVGLCLIGLMVFVITDAKTEQKKQQEIKLVKEHSNTKFY